MGGGDGHEEKRMMGDGVGDGGRGESGDCGEDGLWIVN